MVYPCHQLVVITDLSTGEQRFLMGHTAKVTRKEEGGREWEEEEKVEERKRTLSLFFVSCRCPAWL